MKPTAAICSRLFLLLLIAHCYFIYAGMGEWRLVSKLLLLPLLILTLMISDRQIALKSPRIVFAGLCFSFLGDLALTQPGEIMFLLGMLAFILTHICNSIFFARIQKNAEGSSRPLLIVTVVLLILCGIIYWFLREVLGAMRIPILVYMGIISTMAVLATGVLRKRVFKPLAIQGLIPGAFLFVCSDALLALNKFSLHQSSIDMAVMLTYGLAQYFLVKGFRLYTVSTASFAGTTPTDQF